MKLTYRTYFDKLEALATNHKTFGHTDEETHFAKVIRDNKNSDAFGRLNVEEVYSGLRSKLKSPMLIAIAYDAQVLDNKSDSKKKVKMGTIFLLKKKTNPAVNLDEVIVINEEMEQVADELFGYLQEEFEQAMEWDTAPNTPMFIFNEISYEAVSPGKDNLCGVRVDFEWQEEAESAFAYKPERFNTPL